MDLLGGELGTGINMFVGGLVVVHFLVLLYWISQFFKEDSRKSTKKHQ